MYKRVFAALIVMGLIVFSCKKKDKNPSPAPSGSGSGTTTGGTTGGGGVPSDSTKFYGILELDRYISVGDYTFTGASAYFSSQAVAYNTSSTSVAVNRVYYNGDSLTKSGTMYFSTGTVNVASPSWSVSGLNGIPSFAFTDPTSLPTFTANFPDSISKSTGFTMTVQVAGTSSVMGGALLSVGDNTTSSYATLLVNGSNTVTISSANLNDVSTTTNGYISISLNSSNAYNFSQKPIQFRRYNYYRKTLKIKP